MVQLSTVLTVIKPALPSLVSLFETSVWYENKRRVESKSYERRGFHLCDNLFLLDDSSLLELRLVSEVGRYEKRNGYTFEPKQVLPAGDVARYLVAEDRDSAAIEAISKAIDRQLNGRTQKRIKQSKERAAKIRAIITLLS